MTALLPRRPRKSAPGDVPRGHHPDVWRLNAGAPGAALPAVGSVAPAPLDVGYWLVTPRALEYALAVVLPRWTAAQGRAAVELPPGATAAQVLGLRPGAIKDLLGKARAACESLGRPAPPLVDTWTPTADQEVTLAAALAARAPYRRIAETIGIDIRALQAHLGVQLGRGRPANRTEARDERIVAAIKSGRSARDVADQEGITTQRIYQIVRAART